MKNQKRIIKKTTSHFDAWSWTNASGITELTPCNYCALCKTQHPYDATCNRRGLTGWRLVGAILAFFVLVLIVSGVAVALIAEIVRAWA